jgi:hypothetical protein
MNSSRRVRARWLWGAALLALAALSATAAGATSDARFTEFRDLHRCEIVRRLAVIQATNRKRDRFLILAMVHHPARYVQCLFDEAGTAMLCEASSGYYTEGNGKSRLFRASPEAVAELAWLGFSTDDSQGNFQRKVAAKSPEDLEAVANLLLTAIYRAYGARPSSAMQIIAPLAPPELGRCVPVG